MKQGEEEVTEIYDQAVKALCKLRDSTPAWIKHPEFAEVCVVSTITPLMLAGAHLAQIQQSDVVSHLLKLGDAGYLLSSTHWPVSHKPRSTMRFARVVRTLMCDWAQAHTSTLAANGRELEKVWSRLDFDGNHSDHTH